MWLQLKSSLGPRWETLERTLHQSCPLLEGRGWPSVPLLVSHWLAAHGGGGGVEPSLKETPQLRTGLWRSMQMGATCCPYSLPLGVAGAAAGKGTGRGLQCPPPVHTQPVGDTTLLNILVLSSNMNLFQNTRAQKVASMSCWSLILGAASGRVRGETGRTLGL